MLEQFGQACSILHRSWEIRTWDLAAVETLLQLRYPKSLELFYQYPTIFMQGGMILRAISVRRRVSLQLQLRALCMQKPCHCREPTPDFQSFHMAAVKLVHQGWGSH